MYSLYEWAEGSAVPVKPKETSNSLATLQDKTSDCARLHWVIVDGSGKWRNYSSNGAAALWRRSMRNVQGKGAQYGR